MMAPETENVNEPFSYTISLQDASAVAVIASFVNQSHSVFLNMEEENTFEFQLPILPEATIETIIKIVRPVITGVKRYLNGLEEFVDYPLDEPILQCIRWTPLAIIDEKATAKNLLDDKRVNLCELQRFILAATYCLEERLPGLWQDFVNSGHDLQTLNTSQCLMGIFWGSVITVSGSLPNCFGSLRIIRTINSGLTLAVKTHNVTATEYFCQRLMVEVSSKEDAMEILQESAIKGLLTVVKDSKCRNQEEQNVSLAFSFHFRNGGKIFRLLMCLMDEEYRIKTMRSAIVHRDLSPGFISLCLLHWPLHTFVEPTLKVLFRSLPNKLYNDCIPFKSMIGKLDSENFDYFHLRILVKQLWKNVAEKDVAFSFLGAKIVERLLRCKSSWTKEYLEMFAKSVSTAVRLEVTELIVRRNARSYKQIGLLMVHFFLDDQERGQSIKRWIRTNAGMTLLHGMIIDENWDCVELTFKWSQLSGEVLPVLMKAINDDSDTCLHLVLFKKWDSLKKFLEWSESSEERLKIELKDKAAVWIRSLMYCQETHIETALTWCFKNIEELLNFDEMLTKSLRNSHIIGISDVKLLYRRAMKNALVKLYENVQKKEINEDLNCGF